MSVRELRGLRHLSRRPRNSLSLIRGGVPINLIVLSFNFEIQSAMKYKIYIITGLTLAYSYLFYHQNAGLNFLIFNTLLIVGLYFNKPSIRHSLPCNFAAMGSLLSATSIAWHHSGLAVFANILSLLVLAGFSLKPNASLVIALANSLYSLVVSLGEKLLKIPNAEGSKAPAQNGLSLGNFLSYTVPVILFLVFLFLYAAGNPVFHASVDGFLGRSFDMISFGWLFFTLSGFWLMFSFFNQTVVGKLVSFDESTPDQLYRKKGVSIGDFNLLHLKYEHKTGWISFGLLNLLLFLFNFIDVAYLLAGKLPEGVSYSAFVHQGVNTLILSIILAITIVMYFFRGNLNFFKSNHKLKVMAYAWILQNAMLLMTTAYKNGLYITEYGLTYKRIGVYFYLLLALGGLLTTYIKVYQVKTNWFLFRKNAWVCYAVMITATLFNWSGIVTTYNLEKLKQKKTDIAYLVSLPDTNLTQLYEALGNPAYQLNNGEEAMIMDKISGFVQRYESQEWPSWSYSDYHIYQTINKQNNER